MIRPTATAMGLTVFATVGLLVPAASAVVLHDARGQATTAFDAAAHGGKSGSAAAGPRPNYDPDDANSANADTAVTDARARPTRAAGGGATVRAGSGTASPAATADGGTACHGRDVATRVTGDFNGDGHDDLAAFYGYADGSVALFTFKGDGKGGFSAPVKSWTAGPGQWTYANAKFVAGDFNGDGHADLAAFYGYADGSVAMFTFLSNPDGTFKPPVKSWTAPAGQWDATRVQLASGRFDGSGRDGVAMLYGGSDGSAGVYTFSAGSDGRFQAPAKSWSTGAGQWYTTSSQLVSGDFNGDGRSDLAALYGYADGSAALFTFTSDGRDGFSAPVKSWNVPADRWSQKNVQLTTGDFNGDRRTDLGAVYTSSDGSVALFTFNSDGNGGFLAPVRSWTVPAGQWYTAHAQFVGGDFDTTGRDEIAAFYGYADGSAAMFTFATDADGNFSAPTRSWSVGANQWWGDSVKLG